MSCSNSPSHILSLGMLFAVATVYPSPSLFSADWLTAAGGDNGIRIGTQRVDSEIPEADPRYNLGKVHPTGLDFSANPNPHATDTPNHRKSGNPDAEVLAFWPFDDAQYPRATLTDAGPHQFDLTLWGGRIVEGRYGGALAFDPESGLSLYYAAYPGSHNMVQRMPDGEPSGLWGPTIPPTRLIDRLLAGGWTFDCWIRWEGGGKSPFTIIDLGWGFDPGFQITIDPVAQTLRCANAYAGWDSTERIDLDGLFTKEWRRLTVTCAEGSPGPLILGLDRREQGTEVFRSIPVQSSPPSPEWPDDLGPEGVSGSGFDREPDQDWRQRHRFNLSLGSNRTGGEGFRGGLDEVLFWVGDPPLDQRSRTQNYGSPLTRHPDPVGPPLIVNSTDVVDLGSRRHLFIDEFLIDHKQSVKIRIHPPRDGRDLQLERGVEHPDWRPSVVAVDDRVYMVIPEGYHSARGGVRLRVSDDGVVFRNPDSALTGGPALPEGDLILERTPLYGNVFEDANPAARPDERYKLTAWVGNRGVYVYTSPDAMHWRRNESIMLPICSGGEAETYWDDQQGCYRAVLKQDESFNHPDAPRGNGGRRGVQFTAREILKPWPFRALAKPYFEGWPFPSVTGEGELVFDSNEQGHVYRTRVIKYPWAPDVYLAFVWRFAKDSERRRIDLGVSRDGVHWEFFADRTWYMEPSPGEEEVLSIYGLIRRGDEIWQYFDFGGAHGRVDRPRRYARFTQRLDGFVSLHSSNEGGRLTTRPIRFSGSRLAVNLDAGPGGEAKFGFVDERGERIPGFGIEDCIPVTGDHLDSIVVWRDGKRDLEQIIGKTVRLEIEMRDADLYAVQFKEDASD